MTVPNTLLQNIFHKSRAVVTDGNISGFGAVLADHFETLGNVTLNGNASVTVVESHVTTSSSIVFTLAAVGGTVGTYPVIQTITPGTGFTVAGLAGDTSTYKYLVIG